MTEDLAHPPQVSINTDTAERIATLYAIGPELARRIVEYRQAHGPFHSPEDLAQVEGVSATLAVTLSPHIDWQVPSPPEESDRPHMGVAVFFLSAAVAFAYTTAAKLVPKLRFDWLAYGVGDYRAGVWIWMDASQAMVLLWVVFSFLVAAAILALPGLMKRIQLPQLIVVANVPLFLGMFSMGLAYAVYYQFYAPLGWSDLLTPGNVLGLSGGVAAVLYGLPLLAVVCRPRLARNRLLLHSWNFSTTLFVPLSAFSVWAQRSTLPLWVLAVIGALGLFYGWLGLASLRSGRHVLHELAADVLLPADQRQEQNRSALLLVWLSARMPDPTEQKALKDALNEAYPPSRLQTFVNVILVGAGGWLLLTVLAAIIEWTVQNWLTGTFGPP